MSANTRKETTITTYTSPQTEAEMKATLKAIATDPEFAGMRERIEAQQQKLKSLSRKTKA